MADIQFLMLIFSNIIEIFLYYHLWLFGFSILKIFKYQLILISFRFKIKHPAFICSKNEYEYGNAGLVTYRGN